MNWLEFVAQVASPLVLAFVLLFLGYQFTKQLHQAMGRIEKGTIKIWTIF
jgi:hypothetical protein